MNKLRKYNFCQYKPLREYIWDNLYKDNYGYFTKKENLQLGQMKENLRFYMMMSQSDYK